MLSEKACGALQDILAHADLALGFLEEMTEESFSVDARTFLAVTRCLEIISEASRRLPEELKARHSAIEWQEMAAAGNYYRHEYGRIAARRVWRTAKDALPPLRTIVSMELAKAPDLSAGSAASR